jgi:hypothetical protein
MIKPSARSFFYFDVCINRQRQLFVVFLIHLLLAAHLGFTQTIIWSETFPDADGTVNDPSGEWTSSCGSCVFLNGDDHFEVRSNQFVGRHMSATGEWHSEWVDISAYSDVSVSVQVNDQNDPDLDDNITVAYSTDGGTSYTNLHNGIYSDDIAGFNVAFAQNINADSISIRVTMATNFGDDIYAFDNVMIVAHEAQPGSGYKLDFDDAPGSTAGDVVELSDNFPNIVGGDFTLMAWINTDNAGATGQRIFADDAFNAVDGFAISLGDPGSGSIRFYIRSVTPVTLDVPLVSPYLITSNEWHHIAATHNAATNTRQIYINGLLVASGVYIGAPGASPDGRASIGGEVAASPESTNRFDGEIDEVSIWNTVLTSAEIRQSMCQKLKGNEGNLLAYYRFDDGVGQMVRDETGNYPGGMVNMDPETDWGVSAVALGDTSIYGYHKADWLLRELVMSSNDGDSLIVGTVLGDPEMVHVYNVNEPPNTLVGADGVGGNGQYYGVFHSFGTLSSYTATYHYRENQGYQSGILDELAMVVYTRDDNADTTWQSTITGVNIIGKTLTGVAINTEFILGNSVTPLPIELLFFEATAVGDVVQLHWETASEVNNDFFTIERSSDAVDFTPVLSVPGTGNSNVRRSYVASDTDPLSGTAYYRLKQTDFNGAYSYSEIVAVTVDHENEGFSIYPNPAFDVIYVMTEREMSSVSVTNIAGLAQEVERVQLGVGRWKINVSTLNPGMYFVSGPANLGLQRKRFIVIEK